MKKNTILSLVLCLCLVLCLFPVGIFADNDEGPYTVILKANDDSKGTVTGVVRDSDGNIVKSGSTLTGLNANDVIEITTTPSQGNKSGRWSILAGDPDTGSTIAAKYKSKDSATKKDCTIIESGQNTLKVKIIAGTGSYIYKDKYSHTLCIIAGFESDSDVIGLNGKLLDERYDSTSIDNTFKIVNEDGETVSNGNATIVSGWNDDADDPMVFSVSFDMTYEDFMAGNPQYYLNYFLNNDEIVPLTFLSSGLSFDFPNATPTEGAPSMTQTNTKYQFNDGFDWVEYDFRIVKTDDESVVLKNCKVIFKYPGLATISAENGSVKYGETTYASGASFNLGTGEKTIEAVPADGYVLAGWTITKESGEAVDISGATQNGNQLTFTVPSDGPIVIAPSFQLIADGPVTVSLISGDESKGTVSSTSQLTGLNVDDEIELVATPIGNSKFAGWVVYLLDDEGYLDDIAEEDEDYELEDKNDPETTFTLLSDSSNIAIIAAFSGPIVGASDFDDEEGTIGPTPTSVGRNTLIYFSRKEGYSQVSNHYGTVSITGWNDDSSEDLIATITLDFAPYYNEQNPFVLGVWKKINGANWDWQLNALAPGVHFDFGELENLYPANIGNYVMKFGEDYDWTEYSFSIKDDVTGNVVKNCKVIFKYPGLATISAENGSVKVGEITYANGESFNLGTGEKTIEAVPADGYVLAGWTIKYEDGTDLDLSAATQNGNQLTFTVPTDKPIVITPTFQEAPPVPVVPEDGDYVVTAVLTGGTGRTKLVDPIKLHIVNGKITAAIKWSSTKIDYMKIGEEKILPVSNVDGAVYNIPVTELDKAIEVIADTTAMSEPKEIEYTITFASDSLMKYVLGDVTGDNEVTADDLTALSRHVAKIEEFTDPVKLAAADVNNDGVISADDLTLLSRYVAKIIMSFDEQ